MNYPRSHYWIIERNLHDNMWFTFPIKRYLRRLFFLLRFTCQKHTKNLDIQRNFGWYSNGYVCTHHDVTKYVTMNWFRQDPCILHFYGRDGVTYYHNMSPNISKPFSQYTNLIVVYVPHLMVLYWCDHGVGCLLLETERSPLQPQGYGLNQLPSRAKEIAASISAFKVSLKSYLFGRYLPTLITSSGFWHYKLSNYYYYA
jgi:hypothetical protein